MQKNKLDIDISIYIRTQILVFKYVRNKPDQLCSTRVNECNAYDLITTCVAFELPHCIIIVNEFSISE